MSDYNPVDPLGDNDDPFNSFSSYKGQSERIDITEFFAERTNAALQRAAKIVVDKKLKNIDSEHLLYSLVSDGEELMDNILKELDLKKDDLKSFIETQLTEGSIQTSNISLTPRAKQILQLAFRESKELRHNYIGTEHILLAILREKEGLGAQILQKHAVSHTKARQAVIKVVGEGDKEGTKVKDNSTTPELDKYSKDITELALQGKIDPVIGRADEITRIIEILARRKKNNPVLIGEPGVGKTAIVEGLAQRIATDNVPDILKNKKVKSLDLSLLVAGSKFRGEFEDRAKKLIAELEKSEREIILFIDELHTIVGSGAKEGELDLANMIKPSLARGELQVVGATTINEYKKYIEKDAALERRFQPILVDEPTVDQTIEILRGIRDRYEAHHRIKISDEALVSASTLSDRYIKDRFLPDKAIDVIDEAASKVRLRVTAEPENLREMKTKIKKLETERESLTRANKHKEAAEIKVNIEQIKVNMTPIQEDWQKQIGTGSPEVLLSDITAVISQVTGIPITELKQEEKDELLKLEERLHDRVVGQDKAIQVVSDAVRRARVGLKSPNRPIATFLFLGPTGVGKTELAKALSEKVFGDEEAMIRLDMSEYMERHAVAKLIGSPPGYIGHEEGGQLTERVRRRPFSLILLDEIEKAHQDVFNILLQIFDDGRLTDSKGRTIDFKNTIIIATSNLGSKIILEALDQNQKAKGAPTPVVTKEDNLIKMTKDTAKAKVPVSWKDIERKLKEILIRNFKPEFLNRIDETIVFKALNKKDLLKIVKLLLEKTESLLHAQNMKFEISEAAIKELTKLGYDPQFGARPLRRIIQRKIENDISTGILSGKFVEGDIIKVDFKDKFTFDK